MPRPVRLTTTTRRPRSRWRLVSSWVVAVLAMVAAGLLVPWSAVATPPTAPAAPAAVGRWQISTLGSHRYEARWTSPQRLPIGSDRPTIAGPSTFGIGAPTVDSDGRTVRAVITAPRAPQATDLDVWLSGSQLDQTSVRRVETPARKADQRRSVRAVRQLAADPSTPGPYAVVSSDYTRPSVKIAGMAQPIEMVGHVVEPAADAVTGPRPLVLFLHGRHSYCYVPGGDLTFDWPCRGRARDIPSQLGYDYVQRLLASQGFTTVSVRVNGINAQDYALDDGGAGARATIVARHLDYWASIAAQHQVDLGRVVLVGHSRGGEGVDRASIRIPLSAPYRIVGQVLIAPTDFAAQTAPYVPTVTLLPYCDGDVSDLQGQRYTDAGRDLATGDTSLKSSVLVMGANHNFFNTEWTPGLSAAPSDDDWSGDDKATCGRASGTRLTAGQQQAVGKAYVAAAVAQFTAEPTTEPAADQPFLPLLDGSAVTVASIGSATVYSHAVGGGRDLRRPSTDSALTLPVGARSSFCTGSSSGDYRAGLCGSELADVPSPHWPDRDENIPARTFWQLSWSAPGQSAGLRLNRNLDLRQRSLDLRTIVDPRLGAASFRVRLTDADGRSATLTPDGGTVRQPLPSGSYVTKLWAQDVRVDPTPAASTIDLASVRTVEVVGVGTKGRLWVADLAASPDRTPDLVAQRAPALSVGHRRVVEGNRQGTVIAEVPFTLSTPMTAAGRFQVLTTGDRPGSLQKFTVDLAPGQRSGSIDVAYPSNRLDDVDLAPIMITIWGLRNVTTDAYLGDLTVLDDDPAPKVVISAVRGTVEEGSSAQWRVTLSGPVNYDVPVEALVVRGPGRDLTGADVPRSWLREHAYPSASKPTLAAMHVRIDATIRTGATSAVLSLPVRKDGVREGREAVTLRATALTTTRTATVRIAKSR